MKTLRAAALNDVRRKHPNVPAHALVIHKYNDSNSNGLTRCIIDWIRLNGGQAERISVTGRRIDQRKTYTDVIGHRRQIGSVKWIPSSMQPGTADVSATIQGVSVKVEVKVGPDRQSVAQAAYQHQIEAAGGLYFIARSFENFYQWFNETFKKKAAPGEDGQKIIK